ncbi:hypothetical protein ACU7A6_15640 [Pseudomonas aeruginosa]|uniref:hypothetical protein n=1 Tax=Pseudomonas aeruginosa TaxID=287 RepID=UPI000A5243C3|nr:hypothetical protein [Pseudomonas aeruginosa]
MPQLMSVPMAAGMTKSAVLATMEPTGAMLPGWKSGVAQALQTCPVSPGAWTEAKSSNWRTAFSSSAKLAGSRTWAEVPS